MSTNGYPKTFKAGWDKQEIQIIPQGYAMHGWGMWHNRAKTINLALFARAQIIQDTQGNCVYFCCLDLGYITYAMREQSIKQLKQAWQDNNWGKFNTDSFILTCTHTHSGPGGCAYEGLYNIVTPGYVPEHVAQIATATATAIINAYQRLTDVTLELTSSRFADDIPVAWNRSLAAYNLNPDVEKRSTQETHLAIDRAMQVLSLRQNGNLVSLLSLFGVHATCVSNRHTCHDGDNKGRAALQVESYLAEHGIAHPVAIFAQGTAGDVSPYFQGNGDKAKRKQIKLKDEFAYAEKNAQYQSQQALQSIVKDATNNTKTTLLTGNVDSILTYVDFTNIHANPDYTNGNVDAYTSEPCHGVAFFEGTRIDGPGMPKFLGSGAKIIAGNLKNKRLKNLANYPKDKQAYFKRIYTAQGVKDILMETGAVHKNTLGYDLDKIPLPSFADPMLGEIKRQAKLGALTNSPMVPTVLPLQIVRIGQIALVCCPGEFTTISGKRMQETLAPILAQTGIEQVLICSYSNEYMGYVTTNEEYQAQCYEGGHTIYGQWTLAAFQTEFAKLAQVFVKPKSQRQYDTTTRPKPVSGDELALRTNIKPPKGFT